MEMRMRRHGHGKVLRRVRRKKARGRLDVRVRRGESGEVLYRVRREKARRCAAVPLRQVRLAAGRSRESSQILSHLRRSVR